MYPTNLLERSELHRQPRVHHTGARGRCVESDLQGRCRSQAFGNGTRHRRIDSQETGVEPGKCLLAKITAVLGKRCRGDGIFIHIIRECEGICADSQEASMDLTAFIHPRRETKVELL
jgi:hypothetical protein